MEFLYPTARQYDFDETCERIVRELEKRNFDVPGVTVEFDTYGSGEQKLRMVRHIRTEHCHLYFCRKQRTLPGGVWNDTAAVNRVSVGTMSLTVYEDFSGPSLTLYAGTDEQWEANRAEFLRGWTDHNDKWRDKQLAYSGACFCDAAHVRHTHRGRLMPTLAHRESRFSRKPVDDEPHRLPTARVIGRLKKSLEGLVLERILKLPVAAAQKSHDELFPTPAPTPFPEGIGPLFTRTDGWHRRRLEQCQRDCASVIAAYRYGLTVTRHLVGGYRLAGHEPPAAALQPSLWCGIGDVSTASLRGGPDQPHVPDAMDYSDRVLCRVRPNRANEVYIADHGAYEGARARLLAAPKAAGRKEFSDQDIAAMYAARCDTMIPITEYRSGYAKPIVLINRELDIDEVEIVGEIEPD